MNFQRMSPTVQNRIASWLSGRKFDPKKLRGVLLGITMTATIGEVCSYRLIKQDIRAGELPNYVADLMIVVFSVFEAIVAPLISCWGFTKRRSLLIGYAAAATLCCTSWFFMPAKLEREKSEFCDAANAKNETGFIGISTRAVIRLTIVIYSCVVFVIVRVACWCHGIAYSDENAPARTSVHYGALLLARVLPFVLGHKIFTGAIENNMTFQIVALIVGFLMNLVQMPFIIPKKPPIVDGVQKIALPLKERSVFESIGRVFYNSVAMTQIFAMGLMAAALWAYGYHELDIIKVKFHLIPERTTVANFAEIFSYYFVAAVIAYAGTIFSAPILMEFCNLKAIKQTVIASVFVFVIFIILTTATSCDTGKVAGLEKSYYGHPECSLSCNCKPQWDEFKPVCVVNDMITYVSPCHAGCSQSQEINGIQVYSNCSCAGGGRVLERSCGVASCRPAYRFHSFMFTVLVTFALLAFQAQGVLLLRAVDPRDKAVVMGVASSTVAIMTFVVGHLIFLGIQVATCSWYEAGKCHLQIPAFPYLVGAICAFLTFTSILTSIMSWICIKIANRNKNESFETRL